MDTSLNIKIFDTHEHFDTEDSRINRPQDPMNIFLNRYLSTDFMSAGLIPDDIKFLRDYKKPWNERWEIFEKYWDYAKTTGYGQAIKIAIRDLYGINDITKETYPRLVEMMNSLAKEGFYKWVMEKANIGKVLLDHGLNLQHDIEHFDKSIFRGVLRFDQLLFIKNFKDLVEASQIMNYSIHDLNDYEIALRRYIRENMEKYVAAKILALVYEYDLKIDYSTKSEAEYAFKAIIEGDGIKTSSYYQPSYNEIRPFHNYMINVLLSELEKLNKPIQIHTGIQDDSLSWPPVGPLYNGNPVYLTNLFKEFPKVKFILFHAGYPYYHEVGVLGKQWPNVFLDLCTVHHINPESYKNILSEWLEMVPNNKIMGFGGDQFFVESSYGGSKIARFAINEVVQEKIEKGHWDKEDGEKVIRRVLWENAERILKD